MITRETKKSGLGLNWLMAAMLVMILGTSTLGISIPDDTSVGTWDSHTKTYTLTANVFGGLVITESGLTLDGAGYTVKGDDGDGYGVEIYEKTGMFCLI